MAGLTATYRKKDSRNFTRQLMTQVLAAESVATQRGRRVASRSRFFLVMAGVMLAIVLSGFAPTLYLRPLFKPTPIPWYLYLHGALLTSWFAVVFVQTVLIQSGRTTMHRRLGVSGVVLAAAIPFAGLMATFGAVPRVLARGLTLDSDASALGIGVSGPLETFLSAVVWANLSSALTFAVLVGTAILLRRRTAAHKRLMIVGTVAILGPALARLARLPIFGGEQGPFTSLVLLVLLAAVVVHDFITVRRIHPATLVGIIFAIGINQASALIASSEVGLTLVRWLQ
jgi:hypothetical protein